MSTLDHHPQLKIEDLLFQLLACIHNGKEQASIAVCAAQSSAHALAQEVVLDLCVDGQRYTLTRSPSLTEERINLSPREQEIIRLVCDGLPNKSISDVLEISPWTVATYLKRIFAKLKVGSRAEMVARVLQDRLLEFPHESYQ